MLDDERVSLLIYKSMRDELSVLEERELNEWINLSEENRNFFERELNEGVLKGVERSLNMNDDRMNQRMTFLLSTNAPVKSFRIWRLMAAAAIAGVLMIGGWLLIRNERENQKSEQAIIAIYDVKPGGNKAVLTLADGNIIVLDSVHNGMIAKQGSSQVMKIAGGQLTYKSVGNSTPVGFNVITTPRGGQYQVILPDGSRVWLNAASSLRFPTAFAGETREVEITGEAYFEVTKDRAKPFHVVTKNMEIEVLGTHFNVMAYSDENIFKTTLLSGSIKLAVSASSDRQPNVILKPGQEARVVVGDNSNNGSHDGLSVIDADIDEAISWKNGVTSFKNEDIKSIMRKIARWYDVDISYENEIPERKFMGGIPRSSSFSDLIKVLNLNHIHTRIEGKKLIVMP